MNKGSSIRYYNHIRFTIKFSITYLASGIPKKNVFVKLRVHYIICMRGTVICSHPPPQISFYQVSDVLLRCYKIKCSIANNTH